MIKPTPLPPAKESGRHYTTPEGYFEGLEERLLAQLPDEAPAEAVTPRPTLWVRLRPILYLAAMFVSFSLLFRAFHTPEKTSTTTASVTTKTPDEEYADYYADYGERMRAGEGYSSYYQDLTGEPAPIYASYE